MRLIYAAFIFCLSLLTAESLHKRKNQVSVSESERKKKKFYKTVNLDKTIQGFVATGDAIGPLFESTVSLTEGQGSFSWYDILIKADELLHNGSFSQAKLLYEKALKNQQFPAEFENDVHVSIARVEIERNKLIEAEKILIQILRNDSKNAEARFFLGVTYARQGKWQASADVYTSLIEFDHENQDALCNLARIKLILGNDAEWSYYVKVLLRIREKLGMKSPIKLSHVSKSPLEDASINDAAFYLVDNTMKVISVYGAFRAQADIPTMRDSNLRATLNLYDDIKFRALFHFHLGKQIENFGDLERASHHYDLSATYYGREHGFLKLRSLLIKEEFDFDDSEFEDDLKCEIILKGIEHSALVNRYESVIKDQARLERISELIGNICSAELNFLDKEIKRRKYPPSDTDSTSVIRVGIVAKTFENQWTFLTDPLKDLSKMGVELHLFHWFDRSEFSWDTSLFDTSRMHLIDPDDMQTTRDIILSESIDVLVFVNQMKYFPTYLLSNSRLAPVQTTFDNYNTFPNVVSTFIDYVLGVPYDIEEIDANSNFFMGKGNVISIQTTKSENATFPIAKGLPLPMRFSYLRETVPLLSEIQGEYLFSDTNYYLILEKINSIHPQFDPVIKRILEVDPDGVVILLTDRWEPYKINVFRERLANRAIDLRRTMLLRSMPRSDYIALIRSVHVVLDVFPNSQVSPLMEAVKIGTPIVTYPEMQMYSKFGAILCESCGFSNYTVARTLEEYVDMAYRVSSNYTYRKAVIREIKNNCMEGYRKGTIEESKDTEECTFRDPEISRVIATQWISLFQHALYERT